jgi:hypothetical protein
MKSFEARLGGKTVQVNVVYRNPLEKAGTLTIERHTPDGVHSDTFYLIDVRLTGEKVIAGDGLELLAVVRDKAQLERVVKAHILPLFAEEQPETVTVVVA